LYQFALILRFTKKEKEILTVNTAGFHLFFRRRKLLNQGIHQKSQNSALSHSQKISMQRHYSGSHKNIWSGFQKYQSKCTKFNFFVYH